MHWSRTIISLLAIGLPLVSTHPLSASTSLDQRSAEIASIPSVDVSTVEHVSKDEKTRRGTLAARDVTELLEYDVAFLDPQGKDSKIYQIAKANDPGRRPKSDPSLKTTVEVKTSSLGPCFALAIVDDQKGGLLGHFTPPFCNWLADPKSVEPDFAKAAGFAKASLVKLLGKQYKNDLATGEVYIVHGPASDTRMRDRQAQLMQEVLHENGIRDKTITRLNVPKDNGAPGGMDDATFAQRIISLEQQANKRLLLKSGGKVLRS